MGAFIEDATFSSNAVDDVSDSDDEPSQQPDETGPSTIVIVFLTLVCLAVVVACVSAVTAALCVIRRRRRRRQKYLRVNYASQSDISRRSDVTALSRISDVTTLSHDLSVSNISPAHLSALLRASQRTEPIRNEGDVVMKGAYRVTSASQSGFVTDNDVTRSIVGYEKESILPEQCNKRTTLQKLYESLDSLDRVSVSSADDQTHSVDQMRSVDPDKVRFRLGADGTEEDKADQRLDLKSGRNAPDGTDGRVNGDAEYSHDSGFSGGATTRGEIIVNTGISPPMKHRRTCSRSMPSLRLSAHAEALNFILTSTPATARRLGTTPGPGDPAVAGILRHGDGAVEEGVSRNRPRSFTERFNNLVHAGGGKSNGAAGWVGAGVKVTGWTGGAGRGRGAKGISVRPRSFNDKLNLAVNRDDVELRSYRPNQRPTAGARISNSHRGNILISQSTCTGNFQPTRSSANNPQGQFRNTPQNTGQATSDTVVTMKTFAGDDMNISRGSQWFSRNKRATRSLREAVPGEGSDQVFTPVSDVKAKKGSGKGGEAEGRGSGGGGEGCSSGITSSSSSTSSLANFRLGFSAKISSLRSSLTSRSMWKKDRGQGVRGHVARDQASVVAHRLAASPSDDYEDHVLGNPRIGTGRTIAKEIEAEFKTAAADAMKKEVEILMDDVGAEEKVPSVSDAEAGSPEYQTNDLSLNPTTYDRSLSDFEFPSGLSAMDSLKSHLNGVFNAVALERDMRCIDLSNKRSSGLLYRNNVAKERCARGRLNCVDISYDNRDEMEGSYKKRQSRSCSELLQDGTVLCNKGGINIEGGSSTLAHPDLTNDQLQTKCFSSSRI